MAAAAVDVLIVGGGPAGAATALSLRQHAPGLRVLIVDAARFPRDKVCGDGLGPAVPAVLAALDAGAVLAGSSAPHAAEPPGWPAVASPAADPVPGQVGSPVEFVVPRRDFDARLLRLARERGVEVWEGIAFRGSTQVREGRDVVLRQASPGRPPRDLTVRARLLVGADGAYSRVRRDLGAPRQPRLHTSVAMRSYALLDAASPRAFRFDFDPPLVPGYGWVFPFGAGRANVGVGIPVAAAGPGGGQRLRAAYDGYLARLPARGLRLVDGQRPRSHLLPHAGWQPPLAWECAALVGDAAAMINPLSGEGIGYALAAGLILGRCVGASVDGAPARSPAGSLSSGAGSPGGSLSSGAREYAAEFHARYARHYAASWLALQAIRVTGRPVPGRGGESVIASVARFVSI